jgi:hypothetical protein
MMELLRLYAQIALLRRGPQDVPASPLLLALTVAALFAVNSTLGLLLSSDSASWLPQLAVEIAFPLAWYAALLSVLKRSERFLQTATALFGYQLVLSPLFIPAGWLIQRVVLDGTAAQGSPWLLPVGVLGVCMAIWLIAAGARVVKSALEWPMLPSVAVVILQTLVGQALLVALFVVPDA